MNIKITVGDFGYIYTFKLYKFGEKEPINLTGYKVYLETGIIDRELTVIDAGNGVCKYLLLDSDFPEAGKNYDVEIYLKKEGTEKRTVAGFNIITTT